MFLIGSKHFSNAHSRFFLFVFVIVSFIKLYLLLSGVLNSASNFSNPNAAFIAKTYELSYYC